MDVYHVDKKTYGWIFAGLSIGFIGLSQFNTLLLKKYSSEQIIRVALLAQVAISLLFWAGNVAGWWGLPQTLFFLFFLLGSIGFCNPNAAALALAPFSRNAGIASALLGAMQMGTGALASVAVSVFSNGTATPMIGVMAVSSVLALLVLVLARGSLTNRI